MGKVVTLWPDGPPREVPPSRDTPFENEHCAELVIERDGWIDMRYLPERPCKRKAKVGRHGIGYCRDHARLHEPPYTR